MSFCRKANHRNCILINWRLISDPFTLYLPADFIMAYGLMIFAVVTLSGGPYVEDDPLFKTRQPPLEKLYVLGLILQVSGWTKRRYFTEATS